MNEDLVYENEELANAVIALERKNKMLTAQCQLMAITLRENAKVFEQYAGIHRAKLTLDGHYKADINASLAMQCLSAIDCLVPSQVIANYEERVIDEFVAYATEYEGLGDLDCAADDYKECLKIAKQPGLVPKD